MDKASLVGDNLCQGKNDNKSGGIFYGLFLALKTILFFIDNFGIIQEYRTFNGFNGSKRLLDCSQYFNLKEGKNISAMLPRSWKNSFNSGFVIPVKMRFCNKGNDKMFFDVCKNRVSEKKNSKQI